MHFTWTCRQSIASCEKAEAADFEYSLHIYNILSNASLAFHFNLLAATQYSNINYFQDKLNIKCTQVSIIIVFFIALEKSPPLIKVLVL